MNAIPPTHSVLVTGASSGIGAATATQRARNGWRVWGTSRKPRETAGADPVQWLTMDESDEDSVNRGVAAILDEEGQLGAVVCNAGFGIFGSVEEVSIAKALAANRPRVRYTMGPDSKLVPIGTRLLPDWLSLSLIRQHFGLD